VNSTASGVNVNGTAVSGTGTANWAATAVIATANATTAMRSGNGAVERATEYWSSVCDAGCAGTWGF
jgi:hypothetical protein